MSLVTTYGYDYGLFPSQVFCVVLTCFHLNIPRKICIVVVKARRHVPIQATIIGTSLSRSEESMGKDC